MNWLTFSLWAFVWGCALSLVLNVAYLLRIALAVKSGAEHNGVAAIAVSSKTLLVSTLLGGLAIAFVACLVKGLSRSLH